MQRYKNISYIHFDTIDSTNTWTKQNAHTLDQNQITCITAMEQTAGRGRWQRRWVSPRGQNIYATIYFSVPNACPYVGNMGQILSLSCANVLETHGFHPLIKWPNDLLLDGKKVAGILCETTSFEDRIGMVLGIGLNVNMTKELIDTIDQPATSLAQLSGQTWTLEQFLEPLILRFAEDLIRLLKDGFSPFLESYLRLLAYKGQTIQCSDGITSIKGICRGISNEGKMELELADGELILISSGEIQFPKKNLNI